jgi:membrane protein YdbS with pleckstrin-like domain
MRGWRRASSAAVLGIVYFGIGKDALTYAVAALAVIATAVVIVFGITGLVLGIRRLRVKVRESMDDHE